MKPHTSHRKPQTSNIKPETCSHHHPVSPENADCAWCARFRINLDTGGRLCGRCRNDEDFRRTLERQYAVRFGADCAATSYCTVFDTATDAAQCEHCKSDPLFRAFLRGQAVARNRHAQPEGHRLRICPHRGAVLRVELRGCCGGEKTRLDIYRCARRGETHAGRCAECEGQV